MFIMRARGRLAVKDVAVAVALEVPPDVDLCDLSLLISAGLFLPSCERCAVPSTLANVRAKRELHEVMPRSF